MIKITIQNGQIEINLYEFISVKTVNDFKTLISLMQQSDNQFCTDCRTEVMDELTDSYSKICDVITAHTDYYTQSVLYYNTCMKNAVYDNFYCDSKLTQLMSSIQRQIKQLQIKKNKLDKFYNLCCLSYITDDKIKNTISHCQSQAEYYITKSRLM